MVGRMQDSDQARVPGSCHAALPRELDSRGPCPQRYRNLS